MDFQSHIARTESVLRMWRIRNLMEGKVSVFKSLNISEKAHLSFITKVAHAIINQLNNIQKTLYGTKKIQK